MGKKEYPDHGQQIYKNVYFSFQNRGILSRESVTDD